MNYHKVTTINLPKPTDININMMPFIMGDVNSLPEEYKQYQHILDACQVDEAELGKVGYLTIQENFVKADNSQRRGGIHTEKHPERSWGGGNPWGGGTPKPWGGSPWGGLGGLYMLSNISNSCTVWDEHIETPKAHGDCEHLRESLGKGVNMQKGELYWLTDSTPHEALRLEKDAYRQYFRLVTSEVFGWYATHSTANRLGIKPNCRIIHEDKFKTMVA